MTNKENFEHTMNRLKHIAEQGFKVNYIWITDFKRYTLDLEKAEKRGTEKPNLFDYMNLRKHYPLDSIDFRSSFKRNCDGILKKREGQYHYNNLTNSFINIMRSFFLLISINCVCVIFRICSYIDFFVLSFR